MISIRNALLAIILLSLVSPLNGGVNQWKAYTSKREVRIVVMDSQQIAWAATSGGLFSYNFATGVFEEFTPAEGLGTLDLTAVSLDDKGYVWIGGSDGYVQRYSPSTGQWLNVTDIYLDRDHGNSKRINRFVNHGDTLFILSDIGVSVYSRSSLEFKDTFFKFGAAPGTITGSVTGLEYFNDTLWISTRNGIASIPVTAQNPSAPEGWKLYKQAEGLLSTTVNQLLAVDNELFAATSSGLSLWRGSAWAAVSGTESWNIIGMTAKKNPGDNIKFYFIRPNSLCFVDNLDHVAFGATRTLTFSSIDSPSLLGTTNSGLLTNIGDPGDIWRTVLPPGPYSNKFVSLAVDGRGILWSATGSAYGDGFMSFDGRDWKSYRAGSDTNICSDNYYKVSIGKENEKWMSNWGCGVTMVDDTGGVVRTFNTRNGIPPTLEGDDNFVVVGGVAADGSGDTWITNRTAPDSTAVVILTSGDSLDYRVKRSMRNPVTIFTDVVIDRNDTKWFSNRGRFDNEIAQGLFYYNDQSVSPGIARGWGRLTPDDGLTSYQVWSLAVDNNGELWVGSDQGITIIFNPADPERTVSTYHPLRDQTIQSILVDACNNKWIGTKQGVFVLSPDGTSILETYTAENTGRKLLDDDIASIGWDKSNGLIYLGTEKGLSSISTPYVSPESSFDELVLSPNPFVVPTLVPLTVDGLVYSSSLKILTVSGDLVKNVVCPCGRVGFWDGRNESGEFVASGIYLIIAYAEDGTQLAVGKLAVLRK